MLNSRCGRRIKNDAEFQQFRQNVLNSPVSINEKDGSIDISVRTSSGKLGVKADLINWKRLDYYLPVPLPDNFHFNVDGMEIGRPILKKYK